MAVLKRETKNDVNITSPLLVLSYTNITGRDLIALCKVQLGSVSNGIAGNGVYVLKAYIDDTEVLPSSNVSTDNGQTTAFLQSRQISLAEDETLTVTVQGLPADTVVDTDTVLLDVTPAALADIYGPGLTPVDHNTGGTDALRVVDANGAGINAVKISAYLTADYTAGNRGPSFLQGRTQTGVDGRWRNPLTLEDGAYTLVFAKPPNYLSNTTTLTVGD